MGKKTGKLIVLILLLITMVAFSGCISGEINTKVNKDFSGTRSVHLEMTQLAYNYMKESLSMDNFEDSPGIKLAKYEKSTEDGNIILDIVFKVDDMNDLETVKVYKNDKTLIFEDTLFGKVGTDKANDVGISLDYTLEMPGEIIDSNADYADGKKVVWSSYYPTTIRAESKVPAIPGFSVVSLFIVGLLLAVVMRISKM